jgi:hypothetical protein
MRSEPWLDAEPCRSIVFRKRNRAAWGLHARVRINPQTCLSRRVTGPGTKAHRVVTPFQLTAPWAPPSRRRRANERCRRRHLLERFNSFACARLMSQDQPSLALLPFRAGADADQQGTLGQRVDELVQAPLFSSCRVPNPPGIGKASMAGRSANE